MITTCIWPGVPRSASVTKHQRSNSCLRWGAVRAALARVRSYSAFSWLNGRARRITYRAGLVTSAKVKRFTVARDGASYNGSFTFRIWNLDGTPTKVEVQGTIAAARITVN